MYSLKTYLEKGELPDLEKKKDSDNVENLNSPEKLIREYLDEIYEEHVRLPENFGNAILKEVKQYFLENGYEITKEAVLEAMLWCYMCRLQ